MRCDRRNGGDTDSTVWVPEVALVVVTLPALLVAVLVDGVLKELSRTHTPPDQLPNVVPVFGLIPFAFNLDFHSASAAMTESMTSRLSAPFNPIILPPVLGRAVATVL